MKSAYQKYMRDVVTAAHTHFHEHVSRVRGSSSYNPDGSAKAAPGKPPIRVEKALKDAGA